MNNGKTLEFNVDTGKSQSTYRWPPIPDDE